MGLNSNAMAFVPVKASGGQVSGMGGASAPVFSPSAATSDHQHKAFTPNDEYPSRSPATPSGNIESTSSAVLLVRAPGQAEEEVSGGVEGLGLTKQSQQATIDGVNMWEMPSVAHDMQNLSLSPNAVLDPQCQVPQPLVSFTRADGNLQGLPAQEHQHRPLPFTATTVIEQQPHVPKHRGGSLDCSSMTGTGGRQPRPGPNTMGGGGGPVPGDGRDLRPFHLRPAELPDTEKIETNLRAASSFFVDANLKQALMAKSLMCHQFDEPSASVPHTVHTYHSLCALEDVANAKDGAAVKLFGYSLTTYKATNAVDGLPYVLRRLEGFRLTNEKAMVMVERFKAIPHPNVVTLREVFTSKDFGDHSLVFVYDYHPGAQTLEQKYFAHGNEEPIEERVLWSHIIQLSSAIRVMHNAGLACRVVHPSKILITGKNRLRFNCVGVFEVMGYDQTNYSGNTESPVVTRHKQEDLLALGRLIVALACGSHFALQKENLPQSLEFINHNYSNDVIKLTVYLLGNPLQQRLKSVNELMPFIGARFYNEIDAGALRSDILERELTKELDNGRLLRLVVKLGFINERPEFQMDSTWSETGDRYLLKLFRDYVFHQVNEGGQPLLDLGHVIQTLNKLDAGTYERICLMSADGETILVVSYHDLKRCITHTMKELKDASGRV